MQVYALLGMNGREIFEAFFERAFSNPRSSGGGDDDDDDEATKKKSEKRRLLDIETFQRHLFCIGGARDSAKAWLEKSDDVGAENAMLQVHACKINDLEALKRMIRLEKQDYSRLRAAHRRRVDRVRARASLPECSGPRMCVATSKRSKLSARSIYTGKLHRIRWVRFRRTS